MTKEEIGQIIKESRISATLTQSQVAEKLGRPQQTIASWESGKSQPDANTLFELFRVLGRSVDDAFGFKKNVPPMSGDALKIARDYDGLMSWQKEIIRYNIEHYQISNRFLHENLKIFRKKKNLTQQELAQKSGVSLARIQYFETRESILDANQLLREQEAEKIASVLDISPRLLMGLTPTYEQMQSILQPEIFVEDIAKEDDGSASDNSSSSGTA